MHAWLELGLGYSSIVHGIECVIKGPWIVDARRESPRKVVVEQAVARTSREAHRRLYGLCQFR